MENEERRKKSGSVDLENEERSKKRKNNKGRKGRTMNQQERKSSVQNSIFTTNTLISNLLSSSCYSELESNRFKMLVS